MTQQIIAHQKFIRQTPRKLRLVADMVRSMSLDQAIAELKFTRKRAAIALLKVISQAKSNALNNNKLDETSLFIDQIQIMEGPTYKRWQPVSRGRTHSIFKRTSHIKVVLKGKKASKSKDTKPAVTKSTSKKTTSKKQSTAKKR